MLWHVSSVHAGSNCCRPDLIAASGALTSSARPMLMPAQDLLGDHGDLLDDQDNLLDSKLDPCWWVQHKPG